MIRQNHQTNLRNYIAKAKFTGDENWESASTTCQVLVIEEETQMNLSIEGKLENGEQVIITVIVTTENGDPIVNEQITIYIFERKGTATTSSLSFQSGVDAFDMDVRYWNLIETLEMTTDEEGKAVSEWTVSTDNDIQIVAEYAGKVEGEGGENIGSSTASFVEGETPAQLVLISGSQWLILGFGGVIIAILMIGLVIVFKANLLSGLRPMREGLAIIEKQGRVRIASLAENLNLSEEEVREKLERAYQKGRVKGFFVLDEFVTMEKLKDELLEILRDYDTIKIADLADKIGISSKEFETFLVTLIDSKEIKGVIDYENGVFSKEIVEPPIVPPEDEALIDSIKDRKVALDELLNNLETKYSIGSISLEEYLKHFREYRTELASIERSLASTEGIIEKEIRCVLCGGMLPEDATNCPECGEMILNCTVCLLPIVFGDDLVKCPHCKSFAHKNHLFEWIKVKGNCPYCKEKLTDLDIPS